MTTELPPEINDDEPELDDPPILVGAPYASEYVPHEAIGLTHEYVPQHDPYAPVLNTVEDEDPYRSLGGLARPDAYFGAIEFDCPTCEAKGKTLDSDGEKCHVWVDRLGRNVPRKMPCLSRIKLAHERGII
jgi:hypothetical protein